MTESSRPRNGEQDASSTAAGQTPAGGADNLVGRVLDGRYKLLSLIAVGGMGRVYRAEQSSLGRIVAVKVLAVPPGTGTHDPRFQERFALEAAASSKLNHANIVTIFDYGHTEDGTYYIVMEFVEGIPLSRVLKVERRLAPQRAMGIARQVCRALREAHSKHVIHRDLKPSNILLVHKGDEGEQVKVLDFGLAKIMDEAQDEEGHLTRVGTFLGTPEYAAPELSRYGKSDHRSDIWSVGVLLYRMMTGKVPFRGPTDMASILMAMNEPVPPIDPALEIPRRAEALMLKCLEKEPIRRYQAMEELLPAIGTCLMELGVESTSLIQPSMVTAAPVQLAPQRAETLQLDDDEEDRPLTPWLVGGGIALVAAGLLMAALSTDPGPAPAPPPVVETRPAPPPVVVAPLPEAPAPQPATVEAAAAATPVVPAVPQAPVEAPVVAPQDKTAAAAPARPSSPSTRSAPTSSKAAPAPEKKASSAPPPTAAPAAEPLPEGYKPSPY